MEDLSKAKIITRNGVPYYAEGKHAGKRVGSVRQKGKESEHKPSISNKNPNKYDVIADKLDKIKSELKGAEGKSFTEKNKIFKRLEYLFDKANDKQKDKIDKLLDILNQRM